MCAIRVGKGRGDIVPAMGRGARRGLQAAKFLVLFRGRARADDCAASRRPTTRRALRWESGVGRLLGAPPSPRREALATRVTLVFVSDRQTKRRSVPVELRQRADLELTATGRGGVLFRADIRMFVIF